MSLTIDNKFDVKVHSLKCYEVESRAGEDSMMNAVIGLHDAKLLTIHHCVAIFIAPSVEHNKTTKCTCNAIKSPHQVHCNEVSIYMCENFVDKNSANA